MKRITKLDSQDVREKAALKKLMENFIQSGPSKESHLPAIVIQMLRDNPYWLEWTEGRDLLKAVSPYLDKKIWSGALEQSTPRKEFIRANETLDQYFETTEADETWPPVVEQDEVWP